MNVSQKNKGIAFIILAAFGFSMMSACVKLAGSDLPSIQKAFFRNVVALIFISVVMLKNHDSFLPKKGNFMLLIARSFFGTLGIVCNFYALDHLVLSDANMLNKLSPFFAVILSIIILREKPAFVQIIGVLVALTGSICVLKPSLSNPMLIPSIIGLTGGLCAGGAYTLVRKLGQNGENGSLVIFFFSLFSCVACLPFVIFNFSPMTVKQTVYLILAGVFACLGQFSITKAYFYAPAKEISVYDYTQIIFSAVIGFLLFDQIPDYLSILGYLLISGSGIVVFLYNNKTKPKEK